MNFVTAKCNQFSDISVNYFFPATVKYQIFNGCKKVSKIIIIIIIQPKAMLWIENSIKMSVHIELECDCWSDYLLFVVDDECHLCLDQKKTWYFTSHRKFKAAKKKKWCTEHSDFNIMKLSLNTASDHTSTTYIKKEVQRNAIHYFSNIQNENSDTELVCLIEFFLRFHFCFYTWLNFVLL